MEDWQERVIEEHNALSEKILTLGSFLSKGAPGVSDEGRALLRRQRNAMLDYHDALTDRIARFS